MFSLPSPPTPTMSNWNEFVFSPLRSYNMSSASGTNQPLNCTAACKKLNWGNLKVIKEQQEKFDVLSTQNQELEFLFELKNSENEQLKRDRDQTEDRRCWLIIDNEELKGKLDKATKGRASGKMCILFSTNICRV
jgi:hypothetical protein